MKHYIVKIQGDQIEVFKILNGHENKNPNIFVKIIKIDEIIRGHYFMLVKVRSGMDVRKYSFTPEDRIHDT